MKVRFKSFYFINTLSPNVLSIGDKFRITRTITENKIYEGSYGKGYMCNHIYLIDDYGDDVYFPKQCFSILSEERKLKLKKINDLLYCSLPE